MDENPALKGTYTVTGTVIDGGMEIFTVEFAYEHPADRFHARRILRCELQETFDRYGMAGRFDIQAKRTAALTFPVVWSGCRMKGATIMDNDNGVTRLVALCKALGWQGGTIHQVAAETGCKAERSSHRQARQDGLG